MVRWCFSAPNCPELFYIKTYYIPCCGFLSHSVLDRICVKDGKIKVQIRLLKAKINLELDMRFHTQSYEIHCTLDDFSTFTGLCRTQSSSF